MHWLDRLLPQFNLEGAKQQAGEHTAAGAPAGGE